MSFERGEEYQAKHCPVPIAWNWDGNEKWMSVETFLEDPTIRNDEQILVQGGLAYSYSNQTLTRTLNAGEVRRQMARYGYLIVTRPH
jgi:hypothetical protein